MSNPEMEKGQAIQELVDGLVTARDAFAMIAGTCTNIKQAREVSNDTVQEINLLIGRYKKVDKATILDRVRRAIDRSNSLSKEDLQVIYDFIKNTPEEP